MLSESLRKIGFYVSRQSQPVLDFLSNKEPSLFTKRMPQRTTNNSQVFVSNVPVSREDAIIFLRKRNITNKNVMVNIDPSHLIGVKRTLSRNYMQAHIYKGNGEPVDVLTQENPSGFKHISELLFEESIFSCTDSLYLQQRQMGVTHETAIDELHKAYNGDAERGGKRMFTEYSVPPEFIPVVEAAHNLNNRIYFIGMNQYSLRHILASYFSLAETKVLFMDTLRYLTSSLKQKDFKSLLRFKAKEFLWMEHYNYLQPIGHQQISMFKRKIKGVYVTHPYALLPPQNPPVNLNKLKDSESDSNKLEKQAILSVLYGNIWNNSYTNNPFPYIAQSYLALSPSDRQMVATLYEQHHQRYSSVQQSYLEQQLHSQAQ